MWRPKNKKSRRQVPVPPALVALMREEWMRQGRGEGWMFPSPKSADRPRGDFRYALKAACKAAEIPVIHPHALRHSAATAAVWAGASMADLRDLYGWSSDRMPSLVYAHTTAERTRAIVSAASPLADHNPLTSNFEGARSMVDK